MYNMNNILYQTKSLSANHVIITEHLDEKLYGNNRHEIDTLRLIRHQLNLSEISSGCEDSTDTDNLTLSSVQRITNQEIARFELLSQQRLKTCSGGSKSSTTDSLPPIKKLRKKSPSVTPPDCRIEEISGVNTARSNTEDEEVITTPRSVSSRSIPVEEIVLSGATTARSIPVEESKNVSGASSDSMEESGASDVGEERISTPSRTPSSKSSRKVALALAIPSSICDDVTSTDISPIQRDETDRASEEGSCESGTRRSSGGKTMESGTHRSSGEKSMDLTEYVRQSHRSDMVLRRVQLLPKLFRSERRRPKRTPKILDFELLSNIKSTTDTSPDCKREVQVRSLFVKDWNDTASTTVEENSNSTSPKSQKPAENNFQLLCTGLDLPLICKPSEEFPAISKITTNICSFGHSSSPSSSHDFHCIYDAGYGDVFTESSKEESEWVLEDDYVTYKYIAGDMIKQTEESVPKKNSRTVSEPCTIDALSFRQVQSIELPYYEVSSISVSIEEDKSITLASESEDEQEGRNSLWSQCFCFDLLFRKRNDS